MRLVYIAGPYTPQGLMNAYCKREDNINTARYCAAWCASNGIGYYSPHLNSAHMDVIVPEVEYDFWIEMDKKILEHCDALILLPYWKTSNGACLEREFSINAMKPIYEWPEQKDEILQWASDEVLGPLETFLENLDESNVEKLREIYEKIQRKFQPEDK